MQLVGYRRNQDALMETPASVPEEFSEAKPDQARRIVEAVLQEGRTLLTEVEAKDVVSAYGIPVAATRNVASPEEAVAAAKEIGFPVALKILSKEISHKSDVGGVALDIESAEQLDEVAHAMLKRIPREQPEATLDGFTVQPMIRRPGAHELLVGAKEDEVFGPVVMFGQGGTAVEIIKDRAIALPPLNLALARQVMDGTRVARLLAGYRDRPAADREAIALTLVRVAQLISHRRRAGDHGAGHQSAASR
jgi:acetyltransferase